ncbi:MAG: molecular chaperone DnaJ, partial [Blastocatellia bacterium]|nr:molecular chaperone DnaJ [Blastocatellia bacterium]
MLQGATRSVTVERLRVCSRCRGTGAEPGTTPERCPTCHGSGRIRHTQPTHMGSIPRIVPCDRCRGEGD